MIPIRVLAILALAAVAAPAVLRAQPGGAPAPEVRAHVDAFVEAMRGSSADAYEAMAQAHFTPALLGRFTPADRRAMFERIRGDFGAITVTSVRVVDGVASIAARGASGLAGRFELTLEPSAPFRVVRRGVEVGDDGPSDTATVATGLGLTIVKQLVEAQGGRVWASSDAGGVTVGFSLPQAANARADRVGSAAMFAHGASGRLTAHDLEPVHRRHAHRSDRPCGLRRRRACRARSCTKRGRWRGGCGASAAAAASSISPAATACSRRRCCCSTTPRPTRWWSMPVLPPLAADAAPGFVATWPRLDGRVRFEAHRIEDVPLSSADVVVSCHACGALSDVVLERAAAARARVAVLPCCHDHARGDTGDLDGWMAADLAIDAIRASRLRGAATASGRRRFRPTSRRATGS